MINDYTPPYARTIYQHIKEYNQIRTKVFCIVRKLDPTFNLFTSYEESDITDMNVDEKGILEVAYRYYRSWDGYIHKVISFPAEWLQLTGAELEEAIEARERRLEEEERRRSAQEEEQFNEEVLRDSDLFSFFYPGIDGGEE